ncbi:Adenylosuccinate lyase [Venturia nashicola]|uniref:Adenylosuccinate lyase n=1 Tax=Venturia nashicola TaxID=86259 RepID=A0A4Z1P790_9PEZI|nr:Adenylosuccinate lyase [Venturia nashicola]
MDTAFRPLPQLPTGFAPSHDINYKQILLSVKLLYLRRQYKQCATLCEKLAVDLGSKLHPLYHVYLNFFAGLAYDTQARSMSTRSPLIPGILDDSEQFFLRAQQVLPTALSPNESTASHPILEREEAPFSEVDDNSTRSSLNSQFSTTAPSTAASSVSGYHDESNSSRKSSPAERPSPLSVRKYKPLPETPTKTLVNSTSLFSLATSSMLTSTPRSPCSSPNISTFDLKAASSPSQDEDTFASERDQNYEYNEAIHSFNDMISKHITSLQQFRRATEATHEIRRPTSRDGNGKLEMSHEERMERIVKGRARGWRRERFNPHRYEQLCEVALGEL